MSVLTKTDLWEMATGRYAFFSKPPTECIWLEVLRRGILQRKYARLRWECVRSIEKIVDRVLNGQIPDVGPDIINEARRIEERISSLPVRDRLANDGRPIAYFDMGTGVRRKPVPEQKGE